LLQPRHTQRDLCPSFGSWMSQLLYFGMSAVIGPLIRRRSSIHFGQISSRLSTRPSQKMQWRTLKLSREGYSGWKETQRQQFRPTARRRHSPPIGIRSGEPDDRIRGAWHIQEYGIPLSASSTLSCGHISRLADVRWPVRVCLARAQTTFAERALPQPAIRPGCARLARGLGRAYRL
jgi:hypothetical protein